MPEFVNKINAELRRIVIYKWTLFVLAAFLMMSCNMSDEKTVSKRVTLWRKDKIPYGTWVAYENMKYVFPQAAININKNSPDFSKGPFITSTVDSASNSGRTAYIVISPVVMPDANETVSMLNMAARGHYVFISSFFIGKELLDSFHVKTETPHFIRPADSLRVSVYDPVYFDSVAYSYPGFGAEACFSKMDSTIVTILGTNAAGKANFIKLSYVNGGSIFIHLEPFAFTNFFLLHKENKAYYDKVFSYLPADVKTVEWDDYFRNKEAGKSNFSALGFLMKQEAFRWAIILAILLFALLFLIESKRRQRLVPVIAPLRNSSLDFVTTIGQLYFQQKDHKNLARKMAAHFMDHIRSRYNLSTSVLDDAFTERLAYKSGYDKEALRDLLERIKEIDNSYSLSEEELLALSKKLDQFYNNQS